MSVIEIAEHLKVSPALVEQIAAQQSSRGKMYLEVEALDATAIIPKAATESSAGADLHAIEDGFINPGKRDLVKTGLAMAIPHGNVGLICPRSGLALKHGVTVLNAPGVIDADYRGDVGVILYNTGVETFSWKKGDRIAQILFMSTRTAEILVVDSLTSTSRGAGGFGSTGVSP